MFLPLPHLQVKLKVGGLERWLHPSLGDRGRQLTLEEVIWSQQASPWQPWPLLWLWLCVHHRGDRRAGLQRRADRMENVRCASLSSCDKFAWVLMSLSDLISADLEKRHSWWSGHALCSVALKKADASLPQCTHPHTWMLMYVYTSPFSVYMEQMINTTLCTYCP